MTIRFFILQAHYRSTLDFSNEALQGSEKGLRRILQSYKDLRALAKAAGVESGVRGTEGSPADRLIYGEYIDDVAPESAEGAGEAVKDIFEGVYDALCDDLNTPIAIARLFDAVKLINTARQDKGILSKRDLEVLLRLYDDIVSGVLGLRDDSASEGAGGKVVGGLMEMVLEQRAAAKAARDWAASDAIRDRLSALGITVKDTKNGAEWTLE